MNRALYLILTSALVVAGGYVIVLSLMGYSPGYLRLSAAVVLVAGALWWLGRKTRRRGTAKRP